MQVTRVNYKSTTYRWDCYNYKSSKMSIAVPAAATWRQAQLSGWLRSFNCFYSSPNERLKTLKDAECRCDTNRCDAAASSNQSPRRCLGTFLTDCFCRFSTVMLLPSSSLPCWTCLRFNLHSRPLEFSLFSHLLRSSWRSSTTILRWVFLKIFFRSHLPCDNSNLLHPSAKNRLMIVMQITMS